jgi:hypothetical protein
MKKENTMKHSIVLISTLVAFGCNSSVYAYKTRVQNATTGDITVSINLAACRPILVAILKPGETSQIFDTGACCFESVNATGIGGAVLNISSGNIRPWGENWQCFRDLHFKVYEEREHGNIVGLGVARSDL